MLTKYEFEVLKAAQEGMPTQRDIAEITGFSLGTVNKAIKALRDQGFVDPVNRITDEGKKALEPYKVESAIILAAGMGARLAPLSFEKPKAMFEVRGEILIERLIRQLKEVGIDDITIVVGYMKEVFFYLEDEFGVKIAVNADYADRNNHASLRCASSALGNTYVLASDEYYTHNIFERYNYSSQCAVVLNEGPTDKPLFVLDNRGNIARMGRDTEESYFMSGPAYLAREDSAKYLAFLNDEFDRPETVGKSWAQILAEHADELKMLTSPADPSVVFEFDYVLDLVAFDSDFFTNVDSRILDNICKTLACTREDITDVRPVKAGLTNLSTLFEVKGEKYIYRHPGPGTDEIVNRKGEAIALNIAKELGLDDTFIFEEPEEGWKISKFIEGCGELDYQNPTHIERAMQMARMLHTSGKVSPYGFDFYDEGIAIIKILRDMNYPLPRDFDDLASRAGQIAQKMRPEAGEPVLCHNDFYGPNFLVKGEEMRLIDWEYAAMGDPACDLGNFVAQGSHYTIEQTLELLPLYYGREATEVEKRHCLGAVGVVGWYWYVWAMYKGAMGNPVGEWLYIWYRAAKDYLAAAERYYN